MFTSKSKQCFGTHKHKLSSMKFNHLVLTLYFTIIFSIVMSAQNLKLNNDKVDSLLKEYSVQDAPGAALMIIQSGKIILSKQYGIANREMKIRVTEHTNFRLASVTKQFTAMAIMILKEKGLINYDMKITEIWPEFPACAKDITIRHLLTHTSGLLDYEDLIPGSAARQAKDKDVLEMMLKQDSLYFKPGEKYQYSNTGYALLSLVVEKFSRSKFADFLSENIFSKIGMTNTIAYEDGISEVSSRAYGYSRIDSSFILTDQSLTSAVLGDGGIYSSVYDLFKWDQSLYTNELIGSEEMKLAFSNGRLNDGKFIDYGFGWKLEKYKSYDCVYHTGSTIGFRNIIYRIPQKEFTVIFLSNRNEGDSKKLAETITDLFLLD